MSVERHLRRRGAAVLFRRAVPRDLQERMGQKEIVKGLGAIPARSAQYCAYAMWSICEEVFSKVRQDPSLTPSDIDAMVSLYLADVRFADEAARASLSPSGEDAPRAGAPTSVTLHDLAPKSGAAPRTTTSTSRPMRSMTSPGASAGPSRRDRSMSAWPSAPSVGRSGKNTSKSHTVGPRS